MKKPPKKKVNPPQQQRRPGIGKDMHPQPVTDNHDVPGSGKLRDKTALITGADSGIGKAVAILFAKEGADIAIAYLNEHKDAADTKQKIELYGRKCLLLPGDISKETFCNSLVRKTMRTYGKIDILVNNAAIHYECRKPEDLETKKVLHTGKFFFNAVYNPRCRGAYERRIRDYQLFFCYRLPRQPRTNGLCCYKRCHCSLYAQLGQQFNGKKNQG